MTEAERWAGRNGKAGKRREVVVAVIKSSGGEGHFEPEHESDLVGQPGAQADFRPEPWV